MPNDDTRPTTFDHDHAHETTGVRPGIAHTRLSRRSFLRLVALAVLGGALGTGGVNAYRFETERLSLALPGLRRRLRIAWLCDLHYGPFIRDGSVAAWIEATNALVPDLALLGGDIVDHLAPADLAPLTRRLGGLRAPLGVFAVWGNHEYRRFPSERLATFAHMLEDVGVRVLVNEGVLVRDDLFLAGVDDHRHGVPDARAALAARPANTPAVLMTHNPDFLPLVPTETDLTLCGHTHGGQIVLPGVGPIATSSEYGRRFAAGWVRGPALGYVSRGLGVAHVPVRIACPAELTYLTLEPEQAERADST